MAKEIKYGIDARKALEAGVNQLADTWLHRASHNHLQPQVPSNVHTSILSMHYLHLYPPEESFVSLVALKVA